MKKRNKMKKIVLILILIFSIVSLMAFEDLTKENFDEKVKGKNSIVKFHAVWCTACDVLEANMEELDQKKLGVTIYGVDIDHQMGIAKKYGVTMLPTTLYLKDGKVMESEVGIRSTDELRTSIKNTYN